MHKLKGLFSLLAAAVIYSINDSLIKLVGQHLSAYQQLFIRSFAGIIVALVVVKMIGEKINLKKISKTGLVIFGLTFPFAIIFFTIGVAHAKVATVVFAYYCSFISISLFLGIFFFKEKLTIIKIMSIISVAIGLIFLTFPFSLNELNSGFFAGIASGTIASVYSFLVKKFGSSINIGFLMFMEMVGAFIVSAVFMVFSSQSFMPQATPLIFILCALSGILLVLALPILSYGFHHFDLNLGTIVLSSELFFSPLLAYFIFSERLTALELTGGLFIAASISLPYLFPRLNRTKK